MVQKTKALGPLLQDYLWAQEVTADLCSSQDLRDGAFYWSGQEGIVSERVREEVGRDVLFSGPLLLRLRGTLAREQR